MTALGARPPAETIRCARCGTPIVRGVGCRTCVVPPARAARHPGHRPAPRPHPVEIDPPTQPLAIHRPGPVGGDAWFWVLTAVLVVLLAVGVLGLVRPDLLGLPSVPLFSSTQPAPGTSP